MKTHRRSGVTLIELLTVILIIMILAGLLAPVLQAARNSARKSRAKAETADLVKAWEGYWRTYTNWPVAVDAGDAQTIEMTASRVADLNGTSPNNPFGIKFMDFPKGALLTGFKDPWGNLYKVTLGREDISYTWDYATRVYFRNKHRYEHD